MKRKQLYVLNSVLDEVANVRKTKFAYVIAKNKQTVIKELEAVAQALKPLTEYEEYNKKREALCRQFAIRKPDGSFAVANNEYCFKEEDKSELFGKLEALAAEHAADIAAQQAKAEGEDAQYLDEGVSFTPFIIAEENLPDDLDAVVMSTLLEFGIIN